MDTPFLNRLSERESAHQAPDACERPRVEVDGQVQAPSKDQGDTADRCGRLSEGFRQRHRSTSAIGDGHRRTVPQLPRDLGCNALSQPVSRRSPEFVKAATEI